ncbi:hypothetical protein GCM10011352_16700 [Marinobacterium zhoushanense]|uniref:DUF3299 domain-containing protein n=1 Tax=Marinobacterium zhoushanense TaxID=1679163 RepID=A0ABQ1KB23_9GAMM|nr:DUF3299 domain-containing protein [Marinobacterium zhoushanense]GGB91312.1 hypothetical protein GCM10011352_16700 [Marinobacterium zhoushanense]
MRKWIHLFLAFWLAASAQAANLNGNKVTEITWDELMPQDYDLSYEDLYGSDVDINNLDDFDSGAQSMLDHMQQVLSSAPVVEEMDGRMVRIPGFVVPLGGEDQRIDRFFLVPYFGACIHTPPPPANQIIDTHFEPGTRIESLYDAVWITGRLTVERFSNELGTAGYRLEAYQIEPYEDSVPDSTQ